MDVLLTVQSSFRCMEELPALAQPAPLMPVSERPLPLTELLQADEVFITGTNKGIVPVVQIDDTVVGNGTPGPWTRKLIQALKDHARTPESKAFFFRE